MRLESCLFKSFTKRLEDEVRHLLTPMFIAKCTIGKMVKPAINKMLSTHLAYGLVIIHNMWQARNFQAERNNRDPGINYFLCCFTVIYPDD